MGSVTEYLVETDSEADSRPIRRPIPKTDVRARRRSPRARPEGTSASESDHRARYRPSAAESSRGIWPLGLRLRIGPRARHRDNLARARGRRGCRPSPRRRSYAAFPGSEAGRGNLYRSRSSGSSHPAGSEARTRTRGSRASIARCGGRSARSGRPRRPSCIARRTRRSTGIARRCRFDCMCSPSCTRRNRHRGTL